VQPSYGLWARHVIGLSVSNSSFNYEKKDNRYPIFLDDVTGAKISSVKMLKPVGVNAVIKLKNASNVVVGKTIYYTDEWGQSPVMLQSVMQAQNTTFAAPDKSVRNSSY
jgi:hypothetical protein